ncbi:MAG: restriction endonuclease subunit S [Pseudonocardiaceae bacterium]
MLDRGKSRGLAQVPYLRNVNVQWDHIDTSELHTMELADDERERFHIRAGDLLICEGGEVGRAAIWNGREEYLTYQKALHRVRSRGQLDLKFLRYLLEHYRHDGTLAQHSTGSTIAHLSQQKLQVLPVPHPPLIEQKRIVEVLEEHLSRLDAGVSGLKNVARRIDILEAQTIRAALTGQAVAGPHEVQLHAPGVDDGELAALPDGWCWMRLSEFADVVGGVTKDSDKQSDPSFVEVPYLRVANVQRGHLDLGTITNIRVSPKKAVALRLIPGDVLLNEGGDRDKLGRGWVWEGQIENCIHQNHVFRARIREGRIDPYLLSWAANSIGGRWCERNGKQSVNLASISLGRIRLMPVPVPPSHEQAALRQHIESVVDGCRIMRSEIATSRARSAALRQSLLEAAFSGRLTASTLGFEMAGEMASV